LDVSGTSRLEGRVIDDDGRPVVDAKVWLKPGDRHATTGADGAFAIDGLATRRYWVGALKEDFCSGPLLVRLREAAEPVVLRMRAGTTLVLRVTANHEPVPGAKITLALSTWLGAAASFEMVEATTAADGVASVRGLAPGLYRGTVVAHGLVEHTLWERLHHDPGSVRELYIRLEPGADIAGRVVGPGNAPVPDARIILWSRANPRNSYTTTSARDGTWRVGLPAGRYRARAATESYGPAAAVSIRSDGRTPRRGVVVPVDINGRIAGTVVDENWKPVPGAWVNTRDFQALARTDETGTFVLSGLLGGACDLYAWTIGKASERTRVTVRHSRAWVVIASLFAWLMPALRLLRRAIGNSKPVSARLQVKDSRLTGVLVDESGRPVPDAYVVSRASAKESSTSYQWVLTNDRGQFDFGGLEPGDYELSASVADVDRGESAFGVDRKGVTAHARTGDIDVKLVMPQRGILTGRVLFLGGPLTYYGVTLQREHYSPFGGSPIPIHASDGRFALRNVDSGTWRLVVLGPGTRRKVIDGLSAGPGETVDIGDIVLERGNRVLGHVRDESGTLVSGARVMIGRRIHDDRSQLQAWFHGEYETRTDGSGAYEFAGIDSQEHHMRPPLLSAVDERAGASLLRELTSDENTVDLVLLGAGSIAGTVYGLQDRVALVYATRDDEPPRARHARVKDGRFHFDDVPPGTYAVSLDTPPTENVTPINVVVRHRKTSQAKILMKSSTVRLIVRVPAGRGRDLRLEPASEGAGIGDRIRMSTGMGSEDRCRFDYVKPGEYRASLDGTAWTMLRVTASPREQTVDLRYANAASELRQP
jgi:protocatechuate 3,4-dioxygenase beta subunit